MDLGYNQLYCVTNKKCLCLYRISSDLKQKVLITDLSSFIDQNEKIDDIFYTTGILDVLSINNNLIVKIGVDRTAEGYMNYRYFIISENIKEITNEVVIKTSYFDIVESSIIFISSDRKYFKEAKSSSESRNISWTIKNSQYNTISTVLSMGNEKSLSIINPIVGVNYQNGSVLHYFVKSNLQNNSSVIIPYTFNPDLDIIMYKIFVNEFLNIKDIEKFTQFDLNILRNLIFAKYNYDFNSKFYQAYFNLYSFYNNYKMRTTRTKNVNDELSEADRSNLELIKSLKK